MLTGVNPDILEMTAQKLLRLIAATAIRHESNVVAGTISLGATLVKPGDELDSLVARADRLMYLSKAEGRNRYSIDP